MRTFKGKHILCGEVKKGKSYFEDAKNIKRLCINWYGLGFIFATPKVRAVLIDSVNEFIEFWINSNKGDE